MREEILRIHNGEKKQKETQILRDIHLEISAGECIGIISDNQYARNTLLNILNGNNCLDHGKVYYKEERIPLQESQKAFIKNVLLLDPRMKKSKELKIEDILFVMNHESVNGFCLASQIYKKTSDIFRQFGVFLDQKEKVSKLSILEKCQLGLMKAYINNYSIVVIADISYILNDEDRIQFMELVAQMRMRGMAFFMIENNEKVLFENVDKICVLTQGATNYVMEQDEFEVNILHKALIGNTIKFKEQKKKRGLQNQKKPKEVLKFSNVSTRMLKEVSFSIQSGEIVSLVCVDSYQGQDIIDLLKGTITEYKGTISLNNQIYSPLDIHLAMQEDVCFIEENPTKPGKLLFYNMNVLDNLSLIMAQKTKQILMGKRYERSIINESKEFFDKSVLQKQVGELSAVEKQKLAYFKWYLYNPDLIICNQPLAGTDIYMRNVTEEMIQKCAEKGIAVLVITANVSVAYEIGNRVILIKNGEIFENY